ncbi:hypothetical protein M5689_009780 [Euphorbia peplus]|nr:hypothetical protein M5689_009780 [Euphorbia peplus]
MEKQCNSALPKPSEIKGNPTPETEQISISSSSLPKISAHSSDEDLDDLEIGISDQMNKRRESPEVQGSYICEGMKKKSKRKRGENHYHHQPNPSPNPKPGPPPTFNIRKIPKLVTWCLEDAEKDLWRPEFSSKNPHEIENFLETYEQWIVAFVFGSENHEVFFC